MVALAKVVAVVDVFVVGENDEKREVSVSVECSAIEAELPISESERVGGSFVCLQPRGKHRSCTCSPR